MARKTTSTTNKKVQKTVALTRKPKKEVAPIVTETVDKTPIDGGKSVKIRKSTVIVALGIVLIALILYYGRGLFVAAIVNGQPISRISLVQEAERESGKQVMAMLVRNVLVEQEASKQNVKVTDKELTDQIKTIEKNLSKQGQNLDDMLKLEGISRDKLRSIVRLDLLVTKLVGKNIKISDKQVADYIEKNSDTLPKEQKGDALKKTARERIKQEMLPEKAQVWLANLEKNANIVNFVNY